MDPVPDPKAESITDLICHYKIPNVITQMITLKFNKQDDETATITGEFAIDTGTFFQPEAWVFTIHETGDTTSGCDNVGDEITVENDDGKI